MPELRGSPRRGDADELLPDLLHVPHLLCVAAPAGRRLLRVLLVFGPTLPVEAAWSVVALLLTPFPVLKRFGWLSPLPLFKRSALVVQTERAGREPPLDQTPHGRSLAPTVGIAGTRVAARVVDASGEAAAHAGNCTSDLVAPQAAFVLPCSPRGWAARHGRWKFRALCSSGSVLGSSLRHRGGA